MNNTGDGTATVSGATGSTVTTQGTGSIIATSTGNSYTVNAAATLSGSGTIGGTCVNIGCVPSKTLIRAAEALHNARVAARFAGITAKAELGDWGATIRQKDALVSELRQAKYIDLLPSYGIDYREGDHTVTEKLGND